MSRVSSRGRASAGERQLARTKRQTEGRARWDESMDPLGTHCVCMTRVRRLQRALALKWQFECCFCPLPHPSYHFSFLLRLSSCRPEPASILICSLVQHCRRQARPAALVPYTSFLFIPAPLLLFLLYPAHCMSHGAFV